MRLHLTLVALALVLLALACVEAQRTRTRTRTRTRPQRVRSRTQSRPRSRPSTRVQVKPRVRTRTRTRTRKPKLRDIRGTIRGDIKGDTYSANFEDIVPGASSLAFVFDVTGSMWDDLKQVIAGAKQILNTTLSRQEKPLHNYVLIPFHDPLVGPTTVTSDPEHFQKSLKNLYVQGGGDCPEMSITAIREALLISLPGSFIYVFTDARSKDYYQLPEVLQIIQRKQSQVVFVLTGKCENEDHDGYQAYEKIAATSSGQVFLITKDEVSEVVKFIEVSVQAHKVVLHAADHDEAGTHQWRIPFDPELQEITISVSGPGRRLTLIDPHGNQTTEQEGLVELLNLDKVLIVNLKEPEPGMWTLIVDSTGEHTLRVTGLSTLDFQARFSRRPTFNWLETEFQPVAGINSYVLLNATGLPPPGTFRTMDLLNIGGRPIKHIELASPRDVEQPYLYTVEPFIPPNEPFYISIRGSTHDGFPFVRATKNAVINVLAVKPVVKMPKTHPGYFDYPAEIPCHVTSLLPYHVTWSREVSGVWRKLGDPIHYLDTATNFYRIPEVTESAEGNYRCFANNSKGYNHGTTFLDVEERPPVITVSGNVTVIPGGNAVLTCHVTSNVRFTITWSRVDGAPLHSRRVYKLRNGSLLIRNAAQHDEGMYQCNAVNIGGETSNIIGLIVERPPVVSISPSDRTTFSQGGTIRIECSATGLPEPTLEWLKGTTHLRDIGKVRIGRDGSYLEVVNANIDDEGVYACQAKNRAGTDQASVKWAFTEQPIVTVVESELLVLEGTSVTLQCNAAGVPKPTVRWTKSGRSIVTGPSYEVQSNGHLTIHQAARSDSDIFTCTASNSAGSDSGEIILEVGWLPVIIQPPLDIGIDIGFNATLLCVADGYPEPAITWFVGATRNHAEHTVAEVNSRARQSEETNGLTISDLTLDDEGAYTCTATNFFGSTVATAQLSITGTALPRVDVGGSSKHVIVDESIVLPCRILSGNPPPTRLWYKNREPFTPTGRVSINEAGSIVISSARRDDAGAYVCTATNVIGSHSQDLALQVWIPPHIVRDNEQLSTVEEQSITIPCVTVGNPIPEVSWKKRDVGISLGNQLGYRVASDGSLTVTRPDADDKGVYTCTARNGAGVDRIDVHLDVYLKPRSSGSSETYIVAEGEGITMQCKISRSDPPPAYSWIKDDAELSGNERHLVIEDNGDLTIFASTLSDAGQYTCVATNIAGSAQRNMYLDVQVPPTIRRGPSQIKVLVNETASIHCHSAGLPVPTVTWYRGESVVDNEYHPRFLVVTSSGSSELQIHEAQLGDDDEYICVARNPAGNDRSSVTVDVQRLPFINENLDCVVNQLSGLCEINPLELGSLSLPCNATGDPKPTIRWYYEGEEVDTSDPNVAISRDGTLTLQVVTSGNNGEYVCEAQNERGIVRIVNRVIVHEHPEIDGEGGEGEIEMIWIREGDDVDLLCPANAVPPPTINWFGGEQLKLSILQDHGHIEFLNGGRVFRLTSARVSDTGFYKCVAHNVVGDTTKRIRLDVYTVPRIRDNQGVSSHVVNIDHSVALECFVTGIPFPSIRWFKGLNELSVDNERLQIDDRGQVLRINSALVTDTASYKCIAHNVAGEDSKNFDLDVHVPPTITGQDQNHTVTVNDRLLLTCFTNGIPLPKITWTKNGRPVTSGPGLRVMQDEQAIEFDSVRVADEGEYVCSASNDAGDATKTHRVNVEVPPSIDGDGETYNVSVPLGGSIVLTCDASGDPPPTIVWLKNETPIFSWGENLRISDDGTQLSISDAREADRGQYTCVASNRVGVQTQQHNLDVLVPPVIANPSENVIAVEHDTVTLPCRVYAHPFPEIRWEVYGNPVTPSDRISFSDAKQSLVISDVTVDNATEYTCTATNIVGRAKKQVTLVVHVPATLIYPLVDRVEHTVNEGDKYELRCVANGIPLPAIHWLKDGQPIGDVKYFRLRDNGGVLQVSKADVGRHEGAYECVASNRDGKDSRQMSLVVYVPPVIQGHSKQHSKVIDIGRSEVLECRIKKGKPTPEIKWYNRDNQLIEASRGLVFTNNKQRLHILSAQLSDVGSYWCEASNVAGKSRKDYHLDVIVPPSIRGEDDVTKVSVILDHNVTMECHVTGIPTPDITWLKDGQPLISVRAGDYTISAGGTRLKISGAQESEAGVYQCEAKNSAGKSSKDFDLDVYLPPSIDGDRVVNITVIENTPVTMQCDIDAFPPPTITWFKDSRSLLLRPGLRLTQNDRQLDISWTQEHDAGMYFCEATNVAGKQRKYFRLRVHVIPTISGPSHTVLNHVVGDSIHMVCDPDGIPLPLISWSMDRHALPNDSALLSDGRVLDIYSAKVSHSGTFMCNASNVAGHDTKTFSVVVYEPPSIVDNGDTVTVVVNRDDRLVLECQVSGTPTPQVTWLKNRRPLSRYFDRAELSEDGRFLVVERSDIEDAGKYTCVARNQVGDDRKHFQVDVNVPPTVRDNSQRENRWVAQGNNISLTCDAEGFPVPSIQWLVNGEPLNPTPRVRIQSEGRVLFVSNAKAGDAALYTCVVTNVAGNSAREIELDVYSTPSIEGSDVPDSHDVNRGSAFTLECKVKGFPLPDVEWQKNGYRIATSLHGVLGGHQDYTLEEGGRYLMVASADLQHSGDYSCRAINQAGEDSKQHHVNVRDPPVISDDDSSPNDVTTHVNTPTLLRCSAYGVPSPTIQWLKDGVLLNLTDSTTMTSQFGGRYLRIFNTVLDDEGTYTCVASNEAGQASKSFDLHVNVPPSIEGSDERFPDSIGVPINNTIALRCVIIEGNPFPKIRWWKGRIQLEQGARIRMSNAGQLLEIDDSKTVDTSRYRCVASNVAGDDSKTFDVEVQVSPNFADGNTTDVVDVNEGSPLHIHCKINAVPAPELTWLKDGRPLTPENLGVYVYPGGRTLQIISARASDAGVYTCVATNDVGSDEKDTKVSVNVAPTIDDNNLPTNIQPRVGDEFTLSCPASGNPEPTIKWYRNGIQLDINEKKYQVQAGGRLLTVSDSDLSDSGHYECRAKNKAGRDNKIFRVSVRVPPTISGPEYERRIALQNSAVVLLCDARGIPEPSLSWKKDGLPLDRSNSRYSVLSEGRLLIVLRLQTTDNGPFTCVATNPVGEAMKTYDVVTHVAPVLPDSVGFITVNQGEIATLSCAVNAYPMPEVKWTKNGFPVDVELDGRVLLSANGQILTVNDADEEDVGSYVCLLSNPAGIESRNFKVSVNVPPSIAGPAFRNRTSNVGSSLTLTCDVYAVPKAAITWMKGNEIVRTGERVTLRAGGAMLQIGRTEEGDTGIYTCHASNVAGDASQATKLEIYVPPSIVTSPQNIDVVRGDSAVLDCIVSGTPAPLIEWFKGGVRVTESSHENLLVSNLGQALTIYNAQVTDGVEYVCQASNVAGSESASFHVNILVPPSMTGGDETEHTEVLAGTQTSFDCEVEGGFPSPEIRWLKNGLPLLLSDRVKVLAGGRQLKILNVHESDTATYTCTATNSAGSVSDNFKLDVHIPPMFLSDDDQEITVFVDEPILLDCSVTGIPPPSVSWNKDETRLTDLSSNERSRVRTLLDSQQVFVSSAIVGDTGRYTCMAFSASGSADKNFDVNVYDRTSITGSDKTERISVNVGDTIDLVCDANGTPIPVLTWSKDDLPLVDNTRIPENGGRMFVPSAQLSDEGTYTCIATSPAGTVAKDFDVIVNLPPTIDQRSGNVTAVVGDNVTLECQSDAVPPPVWSWFKNGRQLENDGRFLDLFNVQLSESGDYTCIASNIAGSTSQDIHLSIYDPPTIYPGPDLITGTRGDTVKIPCQAGGFPVPKVSWRKDSAPISSDNVPDRFLFQEEGSIVVDALMVEDAGRYVCLVSNGAGSARRIIQLEVEVPPSILPGSTNLTVTVNNPVTLDCEVTGLPKPSVSWIKNGEKLDTEGDPSNSVLPSGSLRIASAAVSDTGSYRCVVDSPAGSTYRDIALFVQVKPAIADSPTTYTKEPGMYLRIPCDVTGTPSPEATWTKNGLNIDNLNDIYVDSSYGLVFTSIVYQHDARYTCTAVNVAGQASYDVDLKVRVQPTITESQRNYTVFEGDSISLPCDVSGVPQPTVTWRKEAVVVDREDERFVYLQDNSLLISVSQTSDAGTYTCVAQNAAGVALSDRSLDVFTVPQFDTSFPDTKIATVGESLSIPVEIAGHPSPTIAWTRNGNTLESVDGALQIAVVSLSDAGLYSVSARNPAGTASRFFQLVVQSPPSIVTSLDPDITVNEGERIHLEVSVDGKPRPEVTWTKDGLPLYVDGLRIQQNSGGSVLIQKARSTDSGHYIATAFNEAGRSSIEFQALVRTPPVITELPQDVEVEAGERLELLCAARGIPTPDITWRFNSVEVPSLEFALGRSRLVIENARPADAGRYICEASNPAGFRSAVAVVNVQSPPVLDGDFDPERIDLLGRNSRLDCPVRADPLPRITWKKNGQEVVLGDRIHQFHNGSLMIYNTLMHDAGDYTCLAFNDAGSIDMDVKLTLQMAPRFSVEPEDVLVDAGDSFILNCLAIGEPSPDIVWTKDGRFISERATVLRNYSLLLVSSRLDDTGQYECSASNFMGSVYSQAIVTVRVHGGYGAWGQWGSCATTCGSGEQERRRNCDSPPPANGGYSCLGTPVMRKECKQNPCPVDGRWSAWTDWEDCSVTCGRGTRSRSRECNNPSPQYGGLPCNGDATEKLMCVDQRCEVHGGWSNWNLWLPCSRSCGEGSQMRLRQCNNPPPSAGGRQCFGLETSSRMCNVRPCPVNGAWSDWGSWDFCSVSCGGGQRVRERTCSKPPPSLGGEPCPGSNRQQDNCNIEACSVNGNWASWGPWSTCSRTCGGGRANRYRSCSDPPPRFGGRFCYGTDTALKPCGLRACPVNGGWSAWSRWSSCSKTCGSGIRTHTRRCNNPRPRHAGSWCQGDSSQTDVCKMVACRDRPLQGEGVLFGTVNGISFGGSDIFANGTEIGEDKTRIVATISNIPPTVGPALRTQISVLSPIFWTMAREIEGAYNGYTLTGGKFDRNVMVEFANGKVVKMEHRARGVDSRGRLIMESQLEGDFPEINPFTRVSIKDYVEDYVQTGDGSLYAYSDRLISLDGHIMPYTWNHSITYNESRGQMPFLVERLSASDILAVYDIDREELSFQIDVTIGRGEPSDRCPSGFVLHSSGMHCTDENECETQRPCSDICQNSFGSFSCSCPTGYYVSWDGRTCKDVNECETNEVICRPNTVCLNNLGSYRCVIKCHEGSKRSDDGLTCEDINECEDSLERLCEHECSNTIGSYFCSCRHGFRSLGRGRCQDINECLVKACRDDQRCKNTLGGYRCIDDCPTGMEKPYPGAVCVDIDECRSDRHECGPGMICRNTRGGYTCTCPPGFKATGTNPPCADLNECLEYSSRPCPGRCINTVGSFRCICPPGTEYLADSKSCAGLIRIPKRGPYVIFSAQRPPGHHHVACPVGLRWNGRECQDMNECLEVRGICQFSCNNTVGSFKCFCPVGYRLAANGKSCEDINECEEGRLNCLPNQLCFNKRGSASCLNTPCPHDYERTRGGYCLQRCVGPTCDLKAKYAIEYKTVALAHGIGAHTDLVRLAVYTSDGDLHPNTKFGARETFGGPFDIRTTVDGKGVVYTTGPLQRSRTYHVEAEATSRTYDNVIEYHTRFIIFINVAAYAF